MATDAPLPLSARPRPTPWRAPARWGMAAIAWTALAFAWATLRLVPFRRLAPLLGRSIGPVACTPMASAAQERRAAIIRNAIARAATVAPFRADCLRQALAGVLLCRLAGVPTTTHLGARLDSPDDPAQDEDRALKAHAWVSAGRIDLCGGRGAAGFAPVACFARPGRGAASAG